MIFSGIGTPSSNKSEDLQKFAQFLCNNETNYEKEMRVKHNVRPSRQSWITETREYQSLHTFIHFYFTFILLLSIIIRLKVGFSKYILNFDRCLYKC